MTSTKDVTADVFNDTVKGRFPLSSSISAARYWAPYTGDGKYKESETGGPTCAPQNPVFGPHIPRPNVDLMSLSWISLFGGMLGLDHFYANSPATGIAKLLTLGGFGVWWIWDVLQVWLEPDRVLNYGMLPPFDVRFHEPVAQGMITNKKNPYLPTGFSTWATAESLFGLFGAALPFYGKLILWAFHAIFMGIIGVILYYGTQFNTFTVVEKILYALGSIIPLCIGIAHVYRWLSAASRILLYPEMLLKNGEDYGLPLNSEVSKFINPYSNSALETLKKDTPAAIFEGYSSEDIRRMFFIHTPREKMDDECKDKNTLVKHLVHFLKQPLQQLVKYCYLHSSGLPVPSGAYLFQLLVLCVLLLPLNPSQLPPNLCQAEEEKSPLIYPSNHWSWEEH